MPHRQSEAKDKNDKALQKPRNSNRKQSQEVGERSNEIGKLTEQEASQIVAQAYEEAARIVADAEEKAKNITGQTGDRGLATLRHLSDLVKSGSLTDSSYEQIDNLFVQIRHQLAKEAEVNPAKAEELGSLIIQLEYWVESLVVDALKLKSIERWLQGTTELARKLRAELDKK